MVNIDTAPVSRYSELQSGLLMLARLPMAEVMMQLANRIEDRPLTHSEDLTYSVKTSDEGTRNFFLARSVSHPEPMQVTTDITFSPPIVGLFNRPHIRAERNFVRTDSCPAEPVNKEALTYDSLPNPNNLWGTYVVSSLFRIWRAQC